MARTNKTIRQPGVVIVNPSASDPTLTRTITPFAPLDTSMQPVTPKVTPRSRMLVADKNVKIVGAKVNPYVEL